MTDIRAANLFRLDGRRALITGGTSGIGLATAKTFIDAGAHVAVCGRKDDALDKAQELLGDDALTIKADVTKIDDLDQMAARLKDQWDSVNILFANAGVGMFQPFTEIDEKTFDYIFGINVKGVFFTVQKMLPILSDGAVIILTASTAAHLGAPGATAYSASKAAVRSLARTLSTELLDRDIRVLALSPGITKTSFAGEMGLGDAEQEDLIEKEGAGTPVGRAANPEELAAGALFLASDAARYMRGTELLMDGGSRNLDPD